MFGVHLRQTGGMDGETTALADVLRGVRMDGIFYCPSMLTEPWGLSLPPMTDCVWFHVVTSGRGTVAVDGADPVEFRSGDLLLIPRGTGHRAWGATPTATPNVLDLPHDSLSERYGILRHGGGGERTDIVCGGVRFVHPAARALIAALPRVIHLTADDVPRRDWLRVTLDLIDEETRAVRPGGDAIVSRLCDIIVMQSIRTWIDADPAGRTGWLGALRDPRIGRALGAVHLDPGREWSVAALAEEAMMSRSAFAARFTELVGESVMTYVTNWRMQVAHELLASGDYTVATAGRAVGYDGEAAFSRAFKRTTGTAPGQVARNREPHATPLSGLVGPG